MTPIDRLIALCEKATPGPWSAAINDGELLVVTPHNSDGTYYAIAERIGGRRKGAGFKDRSEEIANHQLIAACDPQTILALCAENKRLAEEVERLRGEVDETFYDRLSRTKFFLAPDDCELAYDGGIGFRDAGSSKDSAQLRRVDEAHSTSAVAEEAVRAGFVLVPRKPTQTMIDAARKNGFEGQDEHVISDWDVMIEAALAARKP